MKRTLIVTYISTEYLEVDASDYELTSADLYQLAESKAKEACPSGIDSLEWEWEFEPKPKGSQRKPPDDFWFKSAIGEVAGRTILLIVKDFPLPKKYRPTAHWLDPKVSHLTRIEDINKMLSKDWRSMSPHNGYFGNCFACFKEIDGLKVLGDGIATSMGYMVIENKLVGVLAAAQVYCNKDLDGVFQFES